MKRRDVLVVTGDIGLGGFAAGQPGDGEAVDVEVRRLAGAADQAHELLFGHLECGIRHHVEQPDVQGADVLAAGVVQREDGLPLAPQLAECRQR